MTPSTGLAVGGIEVVRDGEVVLNLAAGQYVLACMARDTPNAKRHLVKGESKILVVASNRGASRAAAKPPSASAEVHMFDFAYRARDRWRRGAQWVRVSSEGKEDHLVLIARLRDGATLREWTAATITDSVATPLTGVARTSPGGVVYLPLALSRTLRPVLSHPARVVRNAAREARDVQGDHGGVSAGALGEE